jgi:hypothetical protein
LPAAVPVKEGVPPYLRFSKKLRNHRKAFEMVFFYINYGFI